MHRQVGRGAERAHLVRNGVGDAFLHHARLLLHKDMSGVQPSRIAFVGSYVARKGVHELKDAMQQVLAAHPRAVLTYFGTGADTPTIQESYPAELRERVLVVPKYRNEDLPGLLSDQHILAFPSRFEGFALTPLEAIACGLIAVAAVTERLLGDPAFGGDCGGLRWKAPWPTRGTRSPPRRRTYLQTIGRQQFAA